MYDMNGLTTAFSEITLVLFTTLAPSGVIAFILAGLPVLAGRVSEDMRLAIDRNMCVPVAVALVGLVASTTHLGNPANALYVLAGVGRSPLSNEVLAGVVFLGLAGIYWLTAFSERSHVGLRRIGLALASVAGAGFVCSIALAYDADTIITWSTPYVPVLLWLGAFAGGPLLALVTLFAAGFPAESGSFGRVLVCVAAAAALAGVVAYALQGAYLAGVENHMTTARHQVPSYFAMLVAHAAAVAAAVVLAAFTLHQSSEGRYSRRQVVVRFAVACVIALAGIFIMRFAFYMMHLTVGLSV